MIFKSLVLSRHSRWRDKTILSRQRMWRDKLFYVKNAVECVVSCRTNACGVTMLFGRACGIGATKRDMECIIFFERINMKIFFKKRLKYKKVPDEMSLTGQNDSDVLFIIVRSYAH